MYNMEYPPLACIGSVSSIVKETIKTDNETMMNYDHIYPSFDICLDFEPSPLYVM